MTLPKDAKHVKGFPGVYRRVSTGELYIHGYITVPRSNGRREHVGPRKATDQGPGEGPVLAAALERRRLMEAARLGVRRETVREWSVLEWFDHTWAQHEVKDGRQAARATFRSKWLVDTGLGDMNLAAVRPVDVLTWWSQVVAHGYAPLSLRNVHGHLMFGLQYAANQQVIPNNPLVTADIRLPRRNRRLKVRLDGPALAKVFEQLQPDPLMWLYIRTLWATGMRPGEAQGIRAEFYVEHTQGLLLMLPRTKTEAPRALPLPPDLAELHRAQLKVLTTPWLFETQASSRTGKPAATTTLRMAWNGAVERAGLIPGRAQGYTLHDMRRAFIALAATLNIRRKVIQEIVGHEGEGVTDRDYDGLFPDEAAAALREIEGYQLSHVGRAVSVHPGVHPGLLVRH